MADKENKKTKEDAPAEKAPAQAPDAGGERQSSSGSGIDFNVFSMFSQKQIAEFKKAFEQIDHDKDGIIGKTDLRANYDSLGRLVVDGELDDMINEASGSINFTQFLTLFANRMLGDSDEDKVVINAMKTLDNDGEIDSEKLKHIFMTWGDKFSSDEVNEA